MPQEASESDYKSHQFMVTALNALKMNKPNDKSEKDRAFAIVITDVEKALAYFDVFVLGVNTASK
jgi:hypothetical protein